MTTVMQKNNTYDSAGIDSSTSDNNMLGGGFLDSLFGSNDKMVNYTDLIMKAVDSVNYDAVDFLLSQKFVPDLYIHDRQKNNILHALAFSLNFSKYARMAFSIILETVPLVVLNHANKSQYTPLHYVVMGGDNELANHMITRGATRTETMDQFIIVTDLMEQSDQPDQMDRADRADRMNRADRMDRADRADQYDEPHSKGDVICVPSQPVELPKVFQKQIELPTVFQKQTTTNAATQYGSLADIVLNFRTSTDINTLQDPDNLTLETDVPENSISIYRPKMSNVRDEVRAQEVRAQEVRDQVVRDMLSNKQSSETNWSDSKFVNNFIEQMKGREYRDDNLVGGASKRTLSGIRRMVPRTENILVGGSDKTSSAHEPNTMSEITRSIRNTEKRLNKQIVEKIISVAGKYHIAVDANDATQIGGMMFKEVGKQKPQLTNLDKYSETLGLVSNETITEFKKIMKRSSRTMHNNANSELTDTLTSNSDSSSESD